MLYSAFTELLREHPLEWWPIGKIYIVGCQWLLFKHIFLFIFSWVLPPEISLHSEPEGKSRGGVWGPSCGCPGEVSSQTFLGHHTVNLLVQMMREKLQILQTSYAMLPLLSVIYGDYVFTWIFKVHHKTIFPPWQMFISSFASKLSKRKPNSHKEVGRLKVKTRNLPT